MAAVRSAVTNVISESSIGYPLATSASTPNAVTVSRPGGRVLGMSVHVLEGVQPSVAGRHQFDDAGGGMNGVPGRLLELAPAQIIRLDLARQRLDEGRRPHPRNQFPDACGADIADHDGFSLLCGDEGLPLPIASLMRADAN